MKLLVVGERTRVSEGLHDFMTRRLHFALGRFAPEVERVTARVGDVNGPRGGMDKRCRMEVKLRGLGSVLSEACADDFEAAVAFAAERLGRGVARALERRSHRETAARRVDGRPPRVGRERQASQQSETERTSRRT